MWILCGEIDFTENLYHWNNENMYNICTECVGGVDMRRIVRSVLVSLVVLLLASPAFAIETIQNPIVAPVMQLMVKAPIPVAFGAVANRYTDVAPTTQFDLNGDLVADVQFSTTTATGKNGATLKLLDPPVLSLDEVQEVPAEGYKATEAVQLNRVYVAKIGTGYTKFMLLQVSPKVTIWFHYGTPTTSVLKVDGTTGKGVLTWDALSDAALGYNIYRYEFLEGNAYSVTQLNDFTVQGTTYTDNTALNKYYVYMVVAIKTDGTFGMQTTTRACQIQSVQRKLVINMTNGTAKVDNTAVTVDSPPVIKNGRMMVPANLLKSAGVTVTYTSTTVTLVRKLENVTYTVVMTLDAPEYTWNGSNYKADVPPYKAGTVVMVPVRVVGPALGFGVMFNSADRTGTLQWWE